MARLKSIFSNNSSQSNSESKRLSIREQRFGKGIVAFDKLVESVSIDGKRDDRDRERLKSTLERFVRDGLITPVGAKMLSEKYLLNTKATPGKKGEGRSLARFGKKRK